MKDFVVDINGLMTYFTWMTEGYIRKKVYEKKIPFIKEGKRILFDPVAVNEWYKKKSIDTTDEIESKVITRMALKRRKK